MNSKKSRKVLIVVFITLILLILSITNITRFSTSIAKTTVPELLRMATGRKSYKDLALSSNGIDMRKITIEDLRKYKWVSNVNNPDDSQDDYELTWGSEGKGAIYCVQRTTGDTLNYGYGGFVVATIIDIKGNDVTVYSNRDGKSNTYALTDLDGVYGHSYAQWLASMIYYRKTFVQNGGYSDRTIGSMYNVSERSFL